MKRGARNALGSRNTVHADGDEDDFGASFVLNRRDVDEALLGNGADASPAAGPVGFRERLMRMRGRLPRAVAIAGVGVAVAAVAAAVIGIAIARF
jgi:hypothetical protein